MTKPDESESHTERSLDPPDWSAFRALSHQMLDKALDLVQGIRERPVWSPVPSAVKKALAEPVPIDPQGAAKVCEDLVQLVLPYATGNIHPRFLGWVQGSGTPGSIIAEISAAAMNSNLGGREHGAIYVERQVIDWCRKLFGFPTTASGLVVTGTSMATFIALTVARFSKASYDVRRLGVQPSEGRLVGYTSTEAHSCIARTFDFLGLGQDALRQVPVDENYKMDIKALRNKIAEDLEVGNKPFCVVGSVGTVNTAAIDDLEELAAISREYNLWFHVDGAFGAIAVFSDILRPLLKGIDLADSIAFDFHKWMHVQYDAGCVLVRHEDLHRDAFTLRPEYLRAAPRGLATGNPWFCEYGPELSRGFRALKIWFTFKEHGIKRIAEKVEENCQQARYLAERVKVHPNLELLARPSLSIVCFRFIVPVKSEEELEDINQEIVMRLQESGIAAPSTTILKGKLAIRVNITNHRSKRADFDKLIDAIVELGCAIAPVDVGCCSHTIALK